MEAEEVLEKKMPKAHGGILCLDKSFEGLELLLWHCSWVAADLKNYFVWGKGFFP